MALNLHRFRTPAQRNRSIQDQMRQEAKRQQELNDQEVKRLQNLMRVETQRQQLLETQENDRMEREFKVEQQRQRDLDGRERLRQVEQRQQPRGPSRTFAAGTTTPEQRLELSAGPTPEEFEAGLRAQAGKPGLLEAIDVPRQIVKRELVDPVVPEFTTDIPVTTALGALGAPLGAVSEVSGALGGPEAPPITSALVEEAASFVLDPLNLVFFAGPVLKATGGAARVANNIRKTGKIPEFVRAAQKLAASEAGGGVFPEQLFPKGRIPTKDPVAKLTEAIKEAKPVRGETAKLQRIALQQKAAKAAEALESGMGEEAFIRARAAQAGELPSAEFEAVRGRFTEEELNSLFEIVRTSDKAVFQGKPFTRVNAGQTLFKVMNGELPTRGEIKLIEEVFGKELAGAIERFRPFRERAWRAFVDAINLPRTLLASFDASFPLRQGVMTAARHPKEFFANFPSMFRAGFSEDFARHVDDIIRTDNTLIKVGDGTATVAELAESGGLFRATLGEFGPLTEREEFFLSTLARKIPGVRISERAFVTYGNKLRHDIFKTALKNWERGGKTITDNEVQGLADLINKLTGRGTLGPANQAAPLLSAAFFAPRFAVSRPQAFLMMFHPQARVRNLAAQEIVTFVGTGIGILGLIKATGVADVEVDPRSSDFGKIRFGDTRLDFWGGNLQWARFVGQMITAQRKGLDGLIIPSDRLKVAERFARTKLSPPLGALIDSPLFAGENLIGEQFPTDALGIANEIRKRMVPLAIQDLAEAIVSEGMSGGLAGLAFVGVGAQTFESRAEKRANLFQEKFNRPFTGKVDDYALIASDADFRAAFPLEGEAKDTQEFFADTADGLRLPEIARSIKQGNTQAGAGFAQAIENYFSTVSSVAARNRFGKDRDVSLEYLTWREIRPEDYLDPVTFLPDWDAYFAVKDEAFNRLDPQLQSAFRKLDVPDVDPSVLADYQRARDLRSNLAEISKWQGLTAEQSRTLDDFSREVSQQTRILSEQSGTRLTEKEVAKVLAEQRDEAGLFEFFVATRSERRRENLRNPEYDAFIGQNKEGLETFYPNLYSLARLERLGIIEEIPTRRGLQPLGLR